MVVRESVDAVALDVETHTLCGLTLRGNANIAYSLHTLPGFFSELEIEDHVPRRGVEAPTFGEVQADQAATAGSLMVGLSVMRASVSRLM
jgi:hypothetical protein